MLFELVLCVVAAVSGIIGIFFTNKVVELREKFWGPIAKDISQSLEKQSIEEETIRAGFGLFNSRSVTIWFIRITGIFCIGFSVLMILNVLRILNR